MEQTLDTPTPSGMSRRNALKTLGSGLGAAALLPLLSPAGAKAFEALQQTGAAPKLLVLSPAQYATVEAFSEAIIPADEHSPGAKAARVADYIDLLLSESDEALKQTWMDGVSALEGAAKAKYKAPFTKLTAPQIEEFLTALSLNLEVASHIVEGPARERVRQAQTLAKLLLADVREAVSQLRHAEAIDLRKALATLTEGVPGLRIHLEMPEHFAVDDPQRAQVLLRCAQETITNAVRHAGAVNLWLRFVRDSSNVLHMHAHDDGVGSDKLVQGNGLIGMRERLARFGGRLDIASTAGRGFVLEAMLPLENVE